MRHGDMKELFMDLPQIKYPAASNGVSSLQRCRAAGYLKELFMDLPQIKNC